MVDACNAHDKEKRCKSDHAITSVEYFFIAHMLNDKVMKSFFPERLFPKLLPPWPKNGQDYFVSQIPGLVLYFNYLQELKLPSL